MDASEHVQSLCNQLAEVFDGNPWYGESLMVKLARIREETDQPQTLSKVAGFIQHMINWRHFAIRKLSGDIDFDIALNTPADWSEVSIPTMAEWDLLIEKLNSSQNQLLSILADKTNAHLYHMTPGKQYSVEFLIHGLIQHDVYHTGQIAVYWKLR